MSLSDCCARTASLLHPVLAGRMTGYHSINCDGGSFCGTAISAAAEAGRIDYVTAALLAA
jgi:hypothetical protein